MGGVVSPGHTNDELVDNLCKGGYIETPKVERVFRILDRKDYMVFREYDDEDDMAYLEAYEDHAMKKGSLHLSAPCIYTKAMETMDIQKGQSFLNLGSGTGYLSTMVGLLLGPTGINHGIEIYPENIEFANEVLNKFKDESPWYDPVEFCEPVFTEGNGLLLSSNGTMYDRIYCGAACPPEHVQLLKNILKIDGILILPCENTLEAVSRVSQHEWTQSIILSTVSFAPLILPSAVSPEDLTAITMVSDVHSLKDLSRLAILSSLTRSNYHLIPSLPLPSYLHKYLSFNRTWEPVQTSLKQICPIEDLEQQSVHKGGLLDQSEGESTFGSSLLAGGLGLPMGGLAFVQRQGQRDMLQVNMNGLYFQVSLDSDRSSDNGHHDDNGSYDSYESGMDDQEQEYENEDTDDEDD